MSLIPGSRFGLYEIRSKLGEGGRGEVPLERIVQRRLEKVDSNPSSLTVVVNWAADLKK
jgi:hypothetical protein